MNTKLRMNRLLVCLAAVIVIASASLALTNSKPQGASGPSGKLKVVGEVTVNGTSAISGATVFSDSTVTTAKGSSAVVSLGKLGRVELLPESTMKLSFTESSIAMSNLDRSLVDTWTKPATSATVNTNDGQVVADGRGPHKFTVDTRCGNTFVSVKVGRVELRAGNSVKQIAAGNQDSAGQATTGCTPGR